MVFFLYCGDFLSFCASSGYFVVYFVYHLATILGEQVANHFEEGTFKMAYYHGWSTGAPMVQVPP